MSALENRGIVRESVEEYLYQLLPERDPVLKSLEADAKKNDVPIIGPNVGSFLFLLATTINAKNILEIGTATGYSGIWLGKVAKKNGGKLTTIEFDPARVKIATTSFRGAGLSDTVEVVTGDAKEEVPKIVSKSPGKFDLVFIDVGDKSLYVDMLEDSIKGLRIGGLLLADNTLWRGLVATKSKEKDTSTLREFNRKVYSDKRLLPALVPLRDGVTVALKVC